MTKKEIQSRVFKNGKKLALNKFSWDEETKTFSSKENGLVLNFQDVDNVTFKTGSGCTFKTGSGCTFKTGSGCTFKTGGYCTFKTGGYCTFNTGDDCTFNTGWNCTFDTGSGCTFKTGGYCTFNTGWNCTFNTRDDCTINAFNNAYVINKHEGNVVIIRYGNAKSIYDLDTLSKDKFLKLNIDNITEKDIKEFEIIDNETMIKLSSDKNIDGINVYKAQYIEPYFTGTDKYVYIAKKGKYNAHGRTIKEAIKDVIFKEQYELGALENAKRVVGSNKVNMNDYRLLTGSCEEGTKRFLDEQGLPYDIELTIEEAINLVSKERAYRSEVFIENLKEAGYKGD